MAQDVTAGERERSRRRPPSVDAVLATIRGRLPGHAPAAVTAVVREVVASERERLARGELSLSPDQLGAQVVARVEALASPGSAAPVRVVNATGVILHTNLGRAVWPEAAIEAARSAAAGYLLLELDRAEGRRGRRYRAVEEHLIALTGADDALVVNNNAAAVALAVGLAGRRGVAVARGEIVEIGGGVRIPEIVGRAGARLVEVGTTNRTRLADFAEVLVAGRVAVVLRVHPSNFRQIGFVEAPDPRRLADLAHEHGAIVVDDLGSGALLDTAAFGLAHEPEPSERLAEGADIVTFSGDKLVGGPQAGLIVGRADLVARLRRDPLARAMRPDKTALAGVAATLALYRAGVATSEIPVWRMIAAEPDAIRRRAELVSAAVAEGSRGASGGKAGAADGGAGGDGKRTPPRVSVVAVRSAIGGGSLPGETLPSWALAVEAPSADRLVATLRRSTPCVIARVEDRRVILDLRTVLPSQDVALADVLTSALATRTPPGTGRTASGGTAPCRPASRRTPGHGTRVDRTASRG